MRSDEPMLSTGIKLYTMTMLPVQPTRMPYSGAVPRCHRAVWGNAMVHMYFLCVTAFLKSAKFVFKTKRSL